MAFEDANVAGAQTSAQVVVGLFADAEDAHRAVTQLRERGFNARQIGAAFRNRSASGLRSEQGAYESVAGGNVGKPHEGWWEKLKDLFNGDESDNKTHETVPQGADTLTRRGYPANENEYDYSGSEIEGSLAGTGIPSERASYLMRNLQSGGAIVTVRCDSRSDEAEQILSANNGRVRYEDASEANMVGRNESRFEGDDVSKATLGSREGQTPEENAIEVDRVQLFGEILKVHKDRVTRGEVRLRKEVVSENQTIEVPVTREELVLERVPVDQNMPTTGKIGDNKEIRVPLTEERVHVEKTPIVTEEVRVVKRQVTDVERVGEEVRHEELRSNDSPTDRGVEHILAERRADENLVNETVDGTTGDETMAEKKGDLREELDQPGDIRRRA